MTFYKPYRPALTSVENQVSLRKQAAKPIPVPKGYTLDGKEEKILWKSYTAARPAEQWLPHDLIQLVKAVQIEMRVREVERKLDASGYVHEDDRGKQSPNLHLDIYFKLIAVQLSIFRGLNMHTTSYTTSPSRMSAMENMKVINSTASKGGMSLIASRK